MNFNPKIKPDPSECPRQFCFFWRPAKCNEQKRTLQERLILKDGDCLCDFGICSRKDAEHGDHDWYETDRANLEAGGAPWFYFIPSPSDVTERNGMREKYIQESVTLWGEEHWKSTKEA